MYATEEKYEKTYNVQQLLSQLNDNIPEQAFIKHHFNTDYYTKNNIKKLYGTPIDEQTDGNQTILKYQFQAKQPQNTIAILLPFSYNNGDNNLYNYAFTLTNGKLETITSEDLKIDVKAFGLLSPPFIHKQKNAGFSPFASNTTCHKDFNNINYIAPHHPATQVQTKCEYNKFFNSYTLVDTLNDQTRRKEGLTRVTIITLFKQDKNIITASQKDYEQLMKKTFTLNDAKRLTDITPIKEQNFANNEIHCKIYTKKGKDFYAPNKGFYPYLILDVANAFCRFKNRDVTFTLQNSNRYPEYMESITNAHQELINTLKTIKYGTPRSFNSEAAKTS